MQRVNIKSALILKSVIYSIFGTIFVALSFAVKDYLTTSQDVFPIEREPIVGLLWVFLGLCFSAVSINLLFRKMTEYFLSKWLFIAVISTVISVFMQMTFLIIRHDLPLKELIAFHDISYLAGFSLMPGLFLALVSFTFLSTCCLFLINKKNKKHILK